MSAVRKRKLALDVDPLQRAQRSQLRRQRALHALERRAIDDEALGLQAATREAQVLTERRAELKVLLEAARRGGADGGAATALSALTSEAADVAARLVAADAEVARLSAAAKDRGARMRHLVDTQARARGVLHHHLTEELRSASGPTGGGGASAGAAAAGGGAATGAAAAAMGPSASPPVPDASPSVDGAAGAVTDGDAGAGAAPGGPVVAAAAAAAGAPAPPPLAAAAASGGAAYYVGMHVCAGCATHFVRSDSVTCSECHRELCGRGGRSAAAPAAWPCVEIARCKCGSVQCYDCVLGGEARASNGWRTCAVCDAWMCEREAEAKVASCGDCGVAPLCKTCRPRHDADCGSLADD